MTHMDSRSAREAVDRATGVLKDGRELPLDMVFELAAHGVDVAELEGLHAPAADTQLSLLPSLDDTFEGN